MALKAQLLFLCKKEASMVSPIVLNVFQESRSPLYIMNEIGNCNPTLETKCAINQIKTTEEATNGGTVDGDKTEPERRCIGRRPTAEDRQSDQGSVRFSGPKTTHQAQQERTRLRNHHRPLSRFVHYIHPRA